MSEYSGWLKQSATQTPVLNDFTTSVLVTRKRDESELRSAEAKAQLKETKTPLLNVSAQFDSELLLSLKTATFLKLCRIQRLLVAEA